ncbi:MAG: hypothetical protein AAFP86_21575, partial [Planctomycetota bacterium]
ADYSVAVGGWLSFAMRENAVVCGGHDNRATGFQSVVVGGEINTASGPSAVVIGGASNRANAEGSVVGGGENNLTDDGQIWSPYTVVSGGLNRALRSATAWRAGALTQNN